MHLSAYYMDQPINQFIQYLTCSKHRLEIYQWNTFLRQWSTLPDIVKGCWITFVKCNVKKSNCTEDCS